jgi:hypothetical protein
LIRLKRSSTFQRFFIQQSNELGAQGKVGGREIQKAFVFCMVNSNSAQLSGIIFLCVEVGEGDSLIAYCIFQPLSEEPSAEVRIRNRIKKYGMRKGRCKNGDRVALFRFSARTNPSS